MTDAPGESIEDWALIDALAACKHPRQMVVTNGPWRRWVCPDCKIEQDHPFTPPPTREPIRLTDEERKRLRDGLRNTPLPATMPADYDYLKRRVLPVMEAAVESILAARLTGGPTLADIVETLTAHEFVAWHGDRDTITAPHCSCGALWSDGPELDEQDWHRAHLAGALLSSFDARYHEAEVRRLRNELKAARDELERAYAFGSDSGL